MKSINFTEKELEFLQQQYSSELANAEQYVDQVKEILKKLGSPPKQTREETTEQEPKAGKRRGRKPKAVVIEPNVPKKRGRKPKTIIIETKVAKKRGRPFKIVTPTVGSAIETASKEPKKRGRKPKAVVPKGEPKKRGRKPKSSVPLSESKPIPAPAIKEEKKIVRKKSPYRRTYKWRGIRLAPMSKPIKLKEPEEEPVDETTPVVEPIEETNIPPTEETKE